VWPLLTGLSQMPNACPTCSHELPIVRCAKCGEVADGETLNSNLEPTGWGWVTDPRGPVFVTALSGKSVSLPRKTLVCEQCRWA